MTEFYKSLVEDVFGCIPEPAEVYKKAVQYYNPGTTDLEAIPYIWNALYTEDEAAMLHLLPATAEEVAQKTGFDRDYVTERLSRLADLGRAMYSPSGFSRLPPVLAQLFDYLFFAMDGRGVPFTKEDLALVKLVQAAQISRAGRAPEDSFQMPMRVIPKYNSIKYVPGVMPCEDMHEIMTSNAASGTLAAERCICKVLDSVWNKGEYPAAGDDNPDYLHEGSGVACGHCLQLGQSGRYFNTYLNAYAADVAEAEQKLEEMEQTATVYVCANNKMITNICSCHFDYCVPKSLNAWAYVPSRFRPYKKSGKCMECGACADVCQFDAIDRDAYTVNPDKCVGCGNCVLRCAPKALAMELIRTPDWIPDGVE